MVIFVAAFRDAPTIRILGKVVLTWPLVGRDDEVLRIRTIMGRKNASGLVVSGDAGVGKTRLVAEALSRVPTSSFAVHRATATTSAATMPFAALCHLLPDDDHVARRSDLLRRTARHLAVQGRSRRVVLAIDDAHLLDEASAALVHHLAIASPVFVLVTVRDGAPAPDAVRLLSKDHISDHLPLTPLSTEMVDAAVRQVLDGPVSGSVVHRLAALSEGNPLVLGELVESALADGRLVRSDGLWRLEGPGVSAQTLPELVRERLSRLRPDAYAAAELVALGEPLGVSEVETMIAPEVVAAAEREGLFTAISSGRRQQVRLAHPLYGEALRAAITPLKARSAYRQLADALASTGVRRRGDMLRLALWRLQGGRAVDPELLLRAAREDVAQFDRVTAERLALAAEDAGGGLEARLERVEALRWQGRAEEIDELLREVDIGSLAPEQRCRVAAIRASNLFSGLNRPDDAEHVIARARERGCPHGAPTGTGAVVRRCSKLDALLAEFRFNAGRVGEAADLAADVLTRPGVSARAYTDAASIATISLAYAGRSDEALTAAEQALTRCSQADGDVSFGVEHRLRLCRCLAHLYAGRLGLAHQLANSGYHQALDLHAEAAQGQWALALGQLALAGGRAVTARRWLREAGALIEARSPTLGRYGVGYACTFAAEAAALGGDLDEADAALSRADALLPDGVVLCNAERGRTWAAAARGEVTTARRLALGSAAVLSRVGAHLYEAMAYHDVVRLGAPTQVRQRLDRLASTIDGHLGSIYARHAHALAAGDGAALVEVADDFCGLGANLLAAEAAAQASAAYRRAGRTAGALAAGERSGELAMLCEGARTPALGLAGGPLPLTPREREIATLAAHGLSNRDIAEALVVSERTVHNHLHRSYVKLGIHTRRQLRSIVR